MHIKRDTIKRGALKGRPVWRAQVYVKGERDSGSFDTKQAALEWASEREHELRTTARTGFDLSHTVAEALQRYARTHSKLKADGGRWDQHRLAFFERFQVLGKPFGEIRLDQFNASHYAALRDARMREVSGATMDRDMNLLSRVFTVARTEWKWIIESPTKDVARPKPTPSRERRISDDEIKRVMFALGYSGGIAESKMQRVAIAFLFAIETAMRAGEIRKLQRGKPSAAGACYLKSASVAYLGSTKNGHTREVPLSPRAQQLVALLPLTGAALFGLGTAPQLDAIFRKALKRAGIADLHFHDTRHEAISRLAKLYPNVLDLARITGHRDLNELRTYYHTTAEELAQAMA